MKFELVVVVGMLMCGTLCRSDERMCLKNTTDEIPAYKTGTDDDFSPFSDATEYIPRATTLWVCCEGYKMSGKECVPTCDEDCPETQVCVKPNVCGCDEGYHLEDNVCHPDCDNCENGRCSGLGLCLCNPGYARIGEKCVPLCRRKCNHGFCESPDKCVCNDGYEMSPETDECEPECDEDCGLNAYCSEPGVCSCELGFFRNEFNSCQKWCTSDCTNGKCVGPNNCVCDHGYVKIDGMCISDCSSGCKFGECTDKDVCVCWPGYTFDTMTRNCELFDPTTTTPAPRTTHHAQFGEAKCPEYCPNGNCTSGSCVCSAGLVRVDLRCTLDCDKCQVGECVMESVCKSHGALTMENGHDGPGGPSSLNESGVATTTDKASACATGCWAGTCIDGVCQCGDGLTLNAENECIRPCEEHCKNGVCGQDGVCTCPDGHVLKNDTECVPVCEKDCKNGFCMAPNQCECHEGYIHDLTPDQEHTCLPTCNGLEGNEGCVNGTCVGVNKCQCVEGLIVNPNNRFECIAYPVDVAERRHKRSWYIYLLLGLLILLLMIILLLLALRKFHQDTYNVERVEKNRATVRYHNGDQPHCDV